MIHLIKCRVTHIESLRESKLRVEMSQESYNAEKVTRFHFKFKLKKTTCEILNKENRIKEMLTMLSFKENLEGQELFRSYKVCVIYPIKMIITNKLPINSQ